MLRQIILAITLITIMTGCLVAPPVITNYPTPTGVSVSFVNGGSGRFTHSGFRSKGQESKPRTIPVSRLFLRNLEKIRDKCSYALGHKMWEEYSWKKNLYESIGKLATQTDDPVLQVKVNRILVDIRIALELMSYSEIRSVLDQIDEIRRTTHVRLVDRIPNGSSTTPYPRGD
jgi:hypothetical protein